MNGRITVAVGTTIADRPPHRSEFNQNQVASELALRWLLSS
jgi:hypothetical protein